MNHYDGSNIEFYYSIVKIFLNIFSNLIIEIMISKYLFHRTKYNLSQLTSFLCIQMFKINLHFERN